MDDKEEIEIKALMGKVNMKTVPADLLKNYESEVLRKIKSTPALPYGLFFSAAFAGAIVMALGTWFYVAKIQPVQPAVAPAADEMVYKEKTPVINHEVMREKQPISSLSPAVPVQKIETLPAPELKEDSEEFQQIANDLFILEMLGEDVDVLDGMQRAASDIELAGQLGTVAF